MLYSVNKFHFEIPERDSTGPYRWKGRDEKARVDSQSLRFFEFGAEAWRWDLCDAIQGSLFARFLHRYVSSE